MAVTTKKLFPATSNATTTAFTPVGIQLNNQDDLDVYVTLSGGTECYSYASLLVVLHNLVTHR